MKRILSLFIALAMLLTTVAAFGAERTDLAREEIPIASGEAEGLQKFGILQGTENGLELERNVTRAEAIVFIWRTTCAAFTDIGYVNPSFADISGHWAYDAIEKFYHAGYINGTSETTFEPERTVTGREFVKIMLSTMGYKDVTIENAYEKGISSQLLSNNFTKTVVYNDFELTRSDCARICFGAFMTKLPDGTMLYKSLIDMGEYNESEFEGVLWSSDAKKNFADDMNMQMPKDKNYMFSPLSIKMALAMAANGAEGQTRDEILDACGIDNLDEFNALAKSMIEKYSKTDIMRLNIANSIWINESRSPIFFNDAYKSKIADFYSGEAGTVNNDNAVEKINGWVNEKTNKKIPTIIEDNDFWASLVNAIYFKASWETEFVPDATKKAEFTDRNGEKSEIDFMNRTSWFSYYENSDKSIRIVKINYKNRLDKFDANGEYTGTDRFDDIDVSMYLMLADDENISAVRTLQEADMSKSQFVALSMPKFTIKFDTSLNDMLKAVGINRAFKNEGDRAQFEPMFTADTMWFTDTIHKTYISVDEKGTEAAAVTAIGMAGSAIPPEPIEFKADRPFTFIIRDNTNGEILFMGEYAFAK